MKTALIVMVPHISHFYPTFGLARLLQEKGLRIVYAGPPSYRERVEEEGFELRPVQYAREFVIERFSIAIGLFIKTLLDAGFTRNRFREFLQNIWEMENLVKSVNPDVVFVDVTLSHYYNCWEGKTVIQLTTRLSPYRSPGIPPLDSYWVPNGHVIDICFANWSWFWHITMRQIREVFENIIFIGNSDLYFYHWFFRKRGVDWLNTIERNVCFFDGLKKVLLLILVPKELEFSCRTPQKDEHYIHILANRNENKYYTSEYKTLKERLIYQKQNGIKLVYVSLGTLLYNHYVVAKQFFKKIALALGNLNGIEVMVSTGGIEVGNVTKASNIHYFSMLPQLDLLPHCDLMITHGGSGTVTECLEAGVPMLVYPLNIRIDQPGVGARVFYKHWGLRGKHSDSILQIRNKTLKTLEAPYKNNCKDIQRILHENFSHSVNKDISSLLSIFKGTSSTHT